MPTFASPQTPAADAPATDAASARSTRRRHAVVVFLLALGFVLTPLAAVSVWVKNQVTSTDHYVRTIEPLARNPAIQKVVADDVATALFARVDVKAEAEKRSRHGRRSSPPRLPRVFGTSPRRRRNGSSRPTPSSASGSRPNRRAHARLVKALTGEGHLDTQNGNVVLDLGPVLADVKRELDDRGINLFDRVPPEAIPTTFVLVKSNSLDSAQRGVRALKALSIVLPIFAALCFAGVIAVSRNRRRTVLQAGLVVTAGVALLGAALTIGRSYYLDTVVGPTLPHDAAAAFYDITGTGSAPGCGRSRSSR